MTAKMTEKTKIIYSNDIMLTLCQSVANVLTSATGTETRYTPLVQKITKTLLTPDIGTFVMFTGSFSGMVVINFPKETAMELYSSYLRNMGLSDEDMAKNYTQEEVSNTLGELMNQILGNFTRQVSEELHIRIDQSQPKMLVLPREVQISISVNLDNPKYGKVTFHTESGNVFYVELAMDDTTFTALRDFEQRGSMSPDDILEQYTNI
jgi:CheY-specific phosphatase CheX